MAINDNLSDLFFYYSKNNHLNFVVKIENPKKSKLKIFKQMS